MSRASKSQLSLQISTAHADYVRSAFLISESNQAAWQVGESWLQMDDAPALIICGPAGCGKSHLAHILANEVEDAQICLVSNFQSPPQADALLLIDDLPFDDPHQFLSFLTAAKSAQSRAILCGRGHPAEWAQGLRDLQTRLEAMPRAVLGEPDEILLRQVIAKDFKDRQLTVNWSVIEFAALRIRRTFADAHAFVATADQLALDENRKISVSLARDIFNKENEAP